MVTVDEIRDRIQGWDESAWCLAALVLALRDPQNAAAAQVLDAAGLAGARAAAGPLAEKLAGQAGAPLLQVARLLVDPGTASWADQPDDALLAQGAASAQAAPMFAQFVLPRLTGLAERFASEGAAMLDVGTGTGALAVAYCEQFPALRVVGIDVLPRVLGLAARVVAASPAGDRVELRRQGIAELTDEAAFDLAWVPAPFIPEDALRDGLARVRAALRPGGWIMVGHGKYGDDRLENALNRFKTVAFGGTALDDEAARALLAACGFSEIVALPTPPGAPALTIARTG